MNLASKPWIERLLEQVLPSVPFTEVSDKDLIGKLEKELGAHERAAEIWDEISQELRYPVVRRGYAYEWNMFRKVLVVTRLPDLVECERLAELYERSTPEELRRRICDLTGLQFENFIRSILSSDPKLTNISITAISHDGGIDFKGVIVNDYVPLPLIGQAKQTKTAVTASLARDFIGALDTSGQPKSVVGLFVSTGGFTEPASEAFRRSRFHIITWDINEVAHRAVKYGVGIKNKNLTITTVDDTFWDELGAKP